jgi:hypothetical protein
MRVFDSYQAHLDEGDTGATRATTTERS